ncbi:DUF5993 family protein [Herbaspirillum sp. WKF16]|jgi:hypothetical protein|uniref:DUF5993 family protein n=1 Tax=Herbaspirillum sp. WKF16 TaxID=3028312 RepID=UPI0023A9F533|nr:DUF5993 family protein [Herbaspirillum sp. WKF16]WDZ95896.1 DUF5993 family protein [Herbaspirillum sp. WKF16]
MFMYLPFLLALLAVLGIAIGWKAFSYAMWLGALGVTLWWFSFHATSALNLSF